MGELASSSLPPPASVVLRVVFVDGEQTIHLGTVQPSLGVKKLESMAADRVRIAPHQIPASSPSRECS
jgi:hypothetical protein